MVSVIAVLAALLLPALGKAKERAVLIRCTSGARQVGMVHSMYMEDYEGVMLATGRAVRGDVWYDRLVREGYTETSLFTGQGGCPHAPGKYLLGDNNNSFYGHNDPRGHTSYAINMALTGSIDYLTKKWSVADWDPPNSSYYSKGKTHAKMTYGRYVNSAEDVMLFQCSTVPNFINYGHRGLTFEHTLGYSTPWIADASKYRRHGGKALPFVFSDGHIEAIGLTYWKTEREREIRWKSICAYNKSEYKNSGQYKHPD